MNTTRRTFLGLASGLGALGLAACSNQDKGGTDSQPSEGQGQESQVDLKEFEGLKLDTGKWLYDKDNDCYYQMGLTYCTKAASATYERLCIFVPGAYFDATANGDTYTCTVKKDATVGSLNPASAPAVMPINSVRLSAQACPEAYSYQGLARYLQAGLVYVYAGFRGRSSGYDSKSKDTMIQGGAPWPIVDLKAAVRYLRYNAASLPINPERIFVFGYGAGGGLSTVMGAQGDADAYAKYLTEIGAATHDAEGTTLSDKVFGSASWCPITSLDSQDAAYEWMMGQFSSTDTRADGTWTQLLSRDLAASYGDYVNGLGLTDGKDKALTLGAVSDGTYLDGPYYEEVMSTIQKSAEDFFGTTTWPYTYTPAQMGDPGFPGDPNLIADSAQAASAISGEDETTDDGSAVSGVTSVSSTVYDSASTYLNQLNSGSRWITYSSSLGTVRISNLWDFVSHCRPATRSVCAYDMIDRSSSFNQLFGIGQESTLHFDQTISDLLQKNQDTYAQAQGFDATYVTAWSEDLQKKDAQDSSMADRVNAMNPLYNLSGRYEGFGTGQVAPHWRINSGLFSSISSLTGELNLALALRKYDGVQDVSYQPVWGRGFELAELQGDPQDNFVAWVVSCCPAIDQASSGQEGSGQ